MIVSTPQASTPAPSPVWVAKPGSMVGTKVVSRADALKLLLKEKILQSTTSAGDSYLSPQGPLTVDRILELLVIRQQQEGAGPCRPSSGPLKSSKQSKLWDLGTSLTGLHQA